MTNATLFVDEPCLGNEIFNEKNLILNRDSCLRSWILLKTEISKIGLNLQTQDLNKVASSSVVIYSDIPSTFPDGHDPEKSIALLFESAVVKPSNWTKYNHDKFKYILTWNDDFVDEKKYFKFNFPQPSFCSINNVRPFAEKKLCALIAANKTSAHHNESYSARVETIKWFEKKHPDGLDLFGYGWDSGVRAKSSLLRRRVARRLPFLSTNDFIPQKTYRGLAESKSVVLRDYRFAICYENATGIPGYITEKIFDCFIAGVVPVYLGPPNINDYIPNSCYIDRNDFQNHRDLYHFLASMGEKKYDQYRDAADAFLRSPSIIPFTGEYFAERISGVAKLMTMKLKY
jgi:alpha(1,3/1,4) fucosyltransferase